MKQQDLTFRSEAGRFTFRVGAIIIDKGRLLMVKHDELKCFYSVGGKVQFNETSEQAVVREVLEETGVEFAVDKLAFINERLYQDSATKELQHEIAFYYLMKSKADLQFACKEHSPESLHWIPISTLQHTKLYPEFIKTKLLSELDCIQHIIEAKTAKLPAQP